MSWYDAIFLYNATKHKEAMRSARSSMDTQLHDHPCVQLSTHVTPPDSPATKLNEHKATTWKPTCQPTLSPHNPNFNPRYDEELAFSSTLPASYSTTTTSTNNNNPPPLQRRSEVFAIVELVL